MLFADMRVSDITIIVKIPLPADTVRVFEDRPQCGLLFVEYGSVYYEQAGKKYLSDGSHVLFIPKGIDYSLRCTKKSMSYVINFDVMDTPPTDSMHNFELAPQQEMYNLLSDLDRAWTFK
ncbi:MAG: hypothetical protein PHG57_06540, partial [Eubacteriales bacterium]|nr:hypothetical protein [Eubacteriales bacterium]